MSLVRWNGAICRRKNKAYHTAVALGKSKCMTEWNVAKSAEVLGVACSFCLCVIAFFVNYFNTKNIEAVAKQKPRHGKQRVGFAIWNEGILLLCGAK